MTFVPLYDRVLVKRKEGSDLTPGGIVIPENAKEKPLEGEIIATGPGRLSPEGATVPMMVRPGTRVLFDRYSGKEVKIDGEVFLIMREEEILGYYR